ncbi:MAG: formylglycine-generating enzyme family protein [Proteobacteria bacterium]|nr:formylglycine-generating enzyme family protein [Pseudomonadota bacterium]
MDQNFIETAWTGIKAFVKHCLFKATDKVIDESLKISYTKGGIANRDRDFPVLSQAEHRYLEAKNHREDRALELQEYGLELQKLHLRLRHQQHQETIALSLQKIQADHDLVHWSGLMSRDETLNLLSRSQDSHRLLLILSEPDVSPSCPDSFRNDFPREARAEVKQFVEQYYPQSNELYPVEFFGKFFKSTVFDTQVKQLENLLAAVPTAVLYSDLTDEKLYLHLHCWGFPQPVAETIAWNWEEAKDKLVSGGLSEKQALREIRKAITGLYQWFSALLADLYYLGVNPLHEPRLLALAGVEEDGLPAQHLLPLRELQCRVLEAYERTAREQTINPPFMLPPAENIHGWPAEKVQDLQRRTADALGRPVHYHDKLKSGSLGPVMTVIPAGSFLMGSRSNEPGHEECEDPQHLVTIAKPFSIGRYAVTWAEWEGFCAATHQQLQQQQQQVQQVRLLPKNVNWYEAQIYTFWLSEQTGRRYRLPSEAEWEYACRAGTTTPFCWGSSITKGEANYDGSGFYYAAMKRRWQQQQQQQQQQQRQITLVPVEDFQPNAFGLHQMHGNTLEWCEDVWHDSYDGAPLDGSAWTAGTETGKRVARGGSYDHSADKLRSACRIFLDSICSNTNLGFRLVVED